MARWYMENNGQKCHLNYFGKKNGNNGEKQLKDYSEEFAFP